MPAKAIIEDLKNEEGNTKKLLENVKYRVGWEKYQRSQKDKENAEVSLLFADYFLEQKYLRGTITAN